MKWIYWLITYLCILLHATLKCYILLQLYYINLNIICNIVTVCKIPVQNRSKNTQYKVFDRSNKIHQHTGMKINGISINNQWKCHFKCVWNTNNIQKFRTDQILHSTRNLAQVTTANQAGIAECNTNVIRERHEMTSPHPWMLASKTRTTPKQMFQEQSILVHASPSVVVRAMGLSRSDHTHSVSKGRTRLDSLLSMAMIT